MTPSESSSIGCDETYWNLVPPNASRTPTARLRIPRKNTINEHPTMGNRVPLPVVVFPLRDGPLSPSGRRSGTGGGWVVPRGFDSSRSSEKTRECDRS
jgi:hypothetical protein